jgi:pyruvate, water dikinase
MTSNPDKSEPEGKEAAAPILWFEDLRREDVGKVGGKNSSLGEMVSTLGAMGVQVPPGFATTSSAYWQFLEANTLHARMSELLDRMAKGKATLADTGKAIRTLVLSGDWPENTALAIVKAYRELSKRAGKPEASVAVRSSATAEDLPDASFAGQQETFLNITGEAALLDSCRRCFASLFTDRAISYRQAKGFDHMSVALSIGVQQMVRSDLAGSGVMFSIDTESGFPDVVVIDAAFGLGENVVQGAVDPDEYQVFKPLLSNPSFTPVIHKKRGGKAIKMIHGSAESPTRNIPTSKAERAAFVLSDGEILRLASWAVTIEGHYGCAMDMEWAKDGETGEMYIVQARPETVQSNRDVAAYRSYRITKKGKPLAHGIAIGDAAVAGRVCMIENARDIAQFVDGSILVTGTTDPDWVPIMKRARAIVTDHGGRTSHAAIVSRELGLPAIVGTGNATEVLSSGLDVTVSCAEGDDGIIYDDTATFESETVDISRIPETRTQVMLNLANPSAALRWWRLPADGVGLARMEFVISNHIRIHPMALVRYETLKDEVARQAISEITAGYADKTEYFVDHLSRGLSRIAAALYPKPVIVRMSDFKTNEYAGSDWRRRIRAKGRESDDRLPWGGALLLPAYREGFALECRAISRLRSEMGFSNVIVMIPFCRSLAEARKVLDVMAEYGLKRGENGLQVYVMCEIPSNVILASEFAKLFDGFSIGSNDLTQLTLGVDRDSSELASQFDEQDAAVKWMISSVISEARKAGAKIGLCGQAPSDHPEFAAFLVECGIDSISVSPDSFVAVKKSVAAAEAKLTAAGKLAG